MFGPKQPLGKSVCILMDHPTDSSEEIFKKQKNCNIQERWVNYKLSFYHQIHLLIKQQRKIKPKLQVENKIKSS